MPYRLHGVDITRGDQFKPEFLAISPNNKMPAITDQDGPGGTPISVFESGAILLYLARKTGKFYATDPRRQVEIEQWLFWQMGGFGPMLGQVHHFVHYAPEQVPYAIKRYGVEAKRLYGVLNAQLAGRDYVAGEYSIADMAIYPWARLWERQGQVIDGLPHVKAWLMRMEARPAVQRGVAIKPDSSGTPLDMKAPKVQAILFGNKG